MKRKPLLFTLLVYSLLQPVFAQQSLPENSIKLGKQRGSIYFTWGYNRDWYTKSTIHFRNTTTDNYDFTFIDAKAHDRPDLHDWYKLNNLTVPQYDMNLGYFFNDKRDLGIEISWDHLKYIVTDNQVMHVQGQIRGHQIDKDTLVTPDFVHLQHTNGNNYLMLNLVKRQQLWHSKAFQLSAIGKVGGGPLISYTISTILGNNDEGYFHYHGMVAALSAGLKLDIFKYFFLQTDFQGAWVDYTNTRLGADHQGLATHHFYSLQYKYQFGFNYPLGSRR
ncbi:membrane protein [Spirosoma migulaei]